MSAAGFILVINLFVAGLLAAAFMTIAGQDRSRSAPRWFAASYLLGMLYIVTEFATPLIGGDAIVVAAFAAFLAATVIFNVGIARRYQASSHPMLLAAFFVVATLGVVMTQDMPRESLLRMTIYQAPYAIMQLMAAALVLRSRRRREWLDHALAGVLIASALQFLSKPLIAKAVGGNGDSSETYIDSTYALISQSMGSVFAFALALIALFVLVRDILADAAVRSQTDTLSSLLNRGGFEAHAATALHAARQRGLPVSLVIADLDHFKQVNDTLGHASGDLVITVFAAFLRSAASEQHVTGRIGGEEFAVLLPGANLAAARLFAEGARNAFSIIAVPGMPVGRRFTASFGVAELAADETVSALMARADKALCAAKTSGRDCVRVSLGVNAARLSVASPAEAYGTG